jgi:hypothetical protein
VRCDRPRRYPVCADTPRRAAPYPLTRGRPPQISLCRRGLAPRRTPFSANEFHACDPCRRAGHSMRVQMNEPRSPVACQSCLRECLTDLSGRSHRWINANLGVQPQSYSADIASPTPRPNRVGNPGRRSIRDRLLAVLHANSKRNSQPRRINGLKCSTEHRLATHIAPRTYPKSSAGSSAIQTNLPEVRRLHRNRRLRARAGRPK